MRAHVLLFMHRFNRLVLPLFLVLALAPGLAAAQATQTVQGTATTGTTATGKPVQVGGVDSGGIIRPLKVAPDGSVTTGAAPYTKTGAPSFSLAVTTTSAYVTGLTASSCYRVACTGTVFWRTGTGTPTALTTDNPFFGPVVESICLPSTDTVLAAITSAGTATCTGTLLARTP